MVINVLIPHRHTPYIAATSWTPAILQICWFSWLGCFIFPLEFEDLPKTGWKCTRPPVSCLELKLSGTHTLGPAHPAPLQPRVQSLLRNSPWPWVWHTLSLFSDVSWWSLNPLRKPLGLPGTCKKGHPFWGSAGDRGSPWVPVGVEAEHAWPVIRNLGLLEE